MLGGKREDLETSAPCEKSFLIVIFGRRLIVGISALTSASFGPRAVNKSEQIKVYFGLSIILTCSVLVRLPFLNVPIISDEGGYAYVAKFWSDQYLPYRDVFFDRPQGIFLLYKLALWSVGSDVSGIRFFAALYNALTTISVFYVTRKLFSVREGLLASAAFAIFSTAPSIEGFTANAELFTLLPLTLSTLMVWRKSWLLSGALAGVATIIKPSGVSGLVVILFWAGLERAPSVSWIRGLIGFALPLLGCLFHGWVIGMGDYVNSFFGARLLIYSPVQLAIGFQISRLLYGIYHSLPSLGIPVIATMLAVSRARSKAVTLCILWFASSWIGMAIGGMWHWHYFQQLLPPLVVLGSKATAAWKVRSDCIVYGFALTVMLLAFVFVDVSMVLYGPNKISWLLYKRVNYLVSKDAAQYIENHSSESDTIYVAFSEAQIYFLSSRKSSLPYLYYAQVEYSEKFFRHVIDSIQNRMPELVVLAQAPPKNRMSYEEFLGIIENSYSFEKRIGSLTIWRRSPVT